jgi:serine/threonine protein kinase
LGDDSSIDDDDEDFQLQLEDRRKYLVHTVTRDGQPRYAIKMVRNDLSSKEKMFMATIDMTCELQFVSHLSHPNIIKVRGVMGYVGRPYNFGIIMDRLSCTLSEKVHEWSQQKQQRSSGVASTFKRSWCRLCNAIVPEPFMSPIIDDLFLERAIAVYDIARAMRHLQSQSLIFRDLKPENVAKNIRGDYVLFDFGLAKELKSIDSVPGRHDLYEATGQTGSRKYMAPEVAQCKNYGLSADVYSFAILFWEVMALRDAFPDMSLDQHYERVVLHHRRPQSLRHTLPTGMNEMMKHSWSKNPSERPTFNKICQIIHRSLSSLMLKGVASESIHDRSLLLRQLSIESHIENTKGIR